MLILERRTEEQITFAVGGERITVRVCRIARKGGKVRLGVTCSSAVAIDPPSPDELLEDAAPEAPAPAADGGYVQALEDAATAAVWAFDGAHCVLHDIDCESVGVAPKGCTCGYQNLNNAVDKLAELLGLDVDPEAPT